MPSVGPLHWLDGEGWLVALGGGDMTRGETDLVDSHVLSIANLDRPMVVLMSEGPQSRADLVIDHYIALGGIGGEALALSKTSIASLQTSTFLSLLSEAGILYLGGEHARRLTSALRNTPALERIVEAFVTLQGLVIVGAGGGAEVLGAWMVDAGSQRQMPGLGLLRNVIIASHFKGTETVPHVQQLLRESPGFLALGVPDGAALAFGPLGQVETWGRGQITAIVHSVGEEMTR
ncbi:MAG: Type 1 glutamine amidotransferase-like domain-containing protein [Anaerolineae bacterium]|nr:Type 1 glutamine amidotransferase-like domain-containing protein [Anaerolineae bacterium]